MLHLEEKKIVLFLATLAFGDIPGDFRCADNPPSAILDG
jgi:hypothetical protein